MSTETRRLNYEDFEFNKLSYNEKQGLLVIDYHERGGSKDGHTHRSLEAPHPNLLESLEALRPHLARALGLQKGWDFAREATRGNDDDLRSSVAGAKDADNSVKVFLVTLMGDGDTAGVKIKGSLKCLNGDMTVNCPVIRFKSEGMAIEKTVEGLIETVKKEAFGFIFQSKRKQYTIEEQEEIDRKKIKGKNKPGKNQLSIDADTPVAENPTEDTDNGML